MDKLVDIIRKYIKTNKNISSDTIKRGILLVILIPLAFIAFAVNNKAEAEDAADKEIPEIEETVSESIYVDIGGAVNEPMLAELPQGSRVEDAIVAAGGLAKDADTSSINRAEFLEDGQKIYIPQIDESGNEDAGAGAGYESEGGSGYVGSGDAGASVSGKISINNADSTQLQELNGVGPATAQKIIDYRNANGRFKTIEELKNVSGIGDKTFEKLKDYITI